MGIESHQDTPLAAAVRKVGSQSAFARLIGLTQGAVWLMLKESRGLPAEHVLTVERETGISRHDLRPDVYGPAPVPAAARPTTSPDQLERAR